MSYTSTSGLVYDLGFVDDASIYNTRPKPYGTVVDNEDFAGFIELGSAQVFVDSLFYSVAQYPKSQTIEQVAEYESNLLDMHLQYLNKAVPHCSGYITLASGSSTIVSSDLAHLTFAEPTIDITFCEAATPSTGVLAAIGSVSGMQILMLYLVDAPHQIVGMYMDLADASHNVTLNILCTADQEWHTSRFFVHDGQLHLHLDDSSTSTSFSWPSLTISALTIGAGSAPAGCMIKDCGLWTEYASDIEARVVNSSYRSGWADPALAVYYRFNEGDGGDASLIYDYAGQNSSGSATSIIRSTSYVSGSCTVAYNSFVDYASLPVWFDEAYAPLDTTLVAYQTDLAALAVTFDADNRNQLACQIPSYFLEDQEGLGTLFVGFLGLNCDEWRHTIKHNIEYATNINSATRRSSTGFLTKRLQSLGFPVESYMRNLDIYTRLLNNNVDYNDARRAILLSALDTIARANKKRGTGESLAELANAYRIPSYLYSTYFVEDSKTQSSSWREYYEPTPFIALDNVPVTKYVTLQSPMSSGSTSNAFSFVAMMVLSGSYCNYQLNLNASDCCNVRLDMNTSTLECTPSINAVEGGVPVGPFSGSSFTMPSLSALVICGAEKYQVGGSEYLHVRVVIPYIETQEVLFDETWSVTPFSLGVIGPPWSIKATSDGALIGTVGYDDNTGKSLDQLRHMDYSLLWQFGYEPAIIAGAWNVQLPSNSYRYDGIDYTTGSVFTYAYKHNSYIASNLDISQFNTSSLGSLSVEINPHKKEYIAGEDASMSMASALSLKQLSTASLPSFEYNDLIEYLQCIDVDLANLAAYTLPHTIDAPPFVVENPAAIRMRVSPTISGVGLVVNQTQEVGIVL